MVIVKLLFNNITKWNSQLSCIFNKDVTIFNINISDDKWYSRIYKDFLNKYKVPQAYLNTLEYDNSFKIYNTIPQQEDYINKHKNKST
jgi:hypothetical protein